MLIKKKKSTAHNFCPNPINFIHHSNLSSHLQNFNSFTTEVIKEFEREVQNWPLDQAEAALSMLKGATKGNNVDFKQLSSKLTVKQFEYVFEVCKKIFPIDEDYDED